ncbi:hypothetical protein D5086_028532 [Populus alba]|uniref:Uncharacterized protein n=2 Tax=Populus alba TaxID=43335 RepID=A0ACC4AYF8_POPAL|nr:hypothetical protein D5086_0000122830 [Populus alba]
MAGKDQTTNDLTQSPLTSNLEAQTTKNIIDQIDELINKEEDTLESKTDDSEEHSPTSQLSPYNAIRKGKQDTVKIVARSGQHERHNLEGISPKIGSAQEISDQLYGRFKSLALSTQHQTTNLQVRKKIVFSKKYGDLYGPEEGEDTGVKRLAELETFEGEELILTGYCGDIEEERNQRKMILRKKDFSALKI